MVLHVLMSQVEIDVWETFADRCRLEVDNAVHAAALSALKYQLQQAGDEVGAHVAEVCERELIEQLGRDGPATCGTMAVGRRRRRSCAAAAPHACTSRVNGWAA